jgi:PPOX class probable F420-dependent enzyme
MPERMSAARQREFLAEGARTAIIVTMRDSGRPHAVPVWYAPDGDDIVLFTGADTVKGRALQANPAVTVVVDDDRPPYAFVSVEGAAELSRDPAELRRCVELIAARYLPPDQAAGFVQYAASPANLLVRVKPHHVTAHDRITA